MIKHTPYSQHAAINSALQHTSAPAPRLRPSVSIVIPTHNEGDDVLDTVDCILRNSGGYLNELIVVDDGSTDHSAEALKVLADAKKIRLLQGKQLGAIHSRNMGAQAANSKIVGFIDAHCYTPQDWLKPIVKEFAENPQYAALSPAIACTKNMHAVGYGATWIDDELAMHWLGQVDKVSDVPFIGGAATFVRKSVFDQINGFDKGIVQWGYEDIELSIRLWLLGYSVKVVPQSVIYHKFRKKFRYDINFTDVLYNKLRLVFLHFDGERLRRLWRHHLQYTGAEIAMQRLHHDGSEGLRDSLKGTRVMSMDNFCDRFGLLQ